jgi:hypothetical protein
MVMVMDYGSKYGSDYGYGYSLEMDMDYGVIWIWIWIGLDIDGYAMNWIGYGLDSV